METLHANRLPVLLMVAVSLGGIAALTSAPTDDEILESARSVIRADRQEVVTNRTVTLAFEDGTTRTFPVRRDVDLGRRQVGEKVLFQIAEMVAISVGKP